MSATYKLSSADHAFNLDKSKFLSSCKRLMNLKKKTFENVMRKGGNAGNQHFLLFTQCFLPFQREIPSIQGHLSDARSYSKSNLVEGYQFLE